MVKVWLLSLAVVFGAAGAVNGQEAEAAPSPYFDCPYINYFDSDCPQLRELWQAREAAASAGARRTCGYAWC